jgi:predicted ATPase
MLDYIQLEGFKSWNHARVPLAPFTVLVGPNGSGKTSVLQGIDCLLRSADQGAEKVFVGALAPEKVRSRLGSHSQSNAVTSNPPLFALSVECVQLKRGLRFEFHAEAQVSLAQEAESEHRWQWKKFSTEAGLTVWVDPDEVKLLTLATAIFAQLDPDCLRSASFSDMLNPVMSRQGYGLPTMLTVWASTQPDKRQQIVDRVRHVIPGLRKVTCERDSNVVGMHQDSSGSWARTSRPYFDALKIDLNGVTGLDADSVSEGTLMALGISALLTIHGDENIVLLIDDIEKGLHPKAQRDLAVMIREIVATTPGLQVICTSHSPYMLDECDPEGIVCVWSGENGSECAKLTEHPDFDRWKDEMRPGELWSMFGEEWVTKHKSPAEEASAS